MYEFSPKTLLSAIGTYKKYNLHSAAPYIGGRGCPGTQKKQWGKRPGKGNVRGEMPRGRIFYTHSPARNYVKVYS